eukprot:2812620-Amphidinium_carterae.1
MFNGSELRTAFIKWREQLVTCSEGGVFGVPEQLLACPTGLELPGQTCSASVVFYKTPAAFDQKAIRGVRVAHPADRAALHIRELQAPILDDEAWLADMQTSETDAKGGTLGNTKVEALGENELLLGLEVKKRFWGSKV